MEAAPPAGHRRTAQDHPVAAEGRPVARRRELPREQRPGTGRPYVCGPPAAWAAWPGRHEPVGESERPGNDPSGTRRGCFLPDLTRVDKAPVRRRPLAGYLMGRGMGGKAARLRGTIRL